MFVNSKLRAHRIVTLILTLTSAVFYAVAAASNTVYSADVKTYVPSEGWVNVTADGGFWKMCVLDYCDWWHWQDFETYSLVTNSGLSKLYSSGSVVASGALFSGIAAAFIAAVTINATLRIRWVLVPLSLAVIVAAAGLGMAADIKVRPETWLNVSVIPIPVTIDYGHMFGLIAAGFVAVLLALVQEIAVFVVHGDQHYLTIQA
ncbi:hypothetical protein CAOG_00811 [Capsaspora owczarzaki ATCC 30864]|uniref:Uncharacterized protein n=1 Tax=Capsaspora owczarzaki (strain ATCC 30864) TaxID=595528 RepID=A0A0D2WHX1_CAPO3|nr:hypothetical protein CAOG_00811 [Capsaspora owczarzaki ATCC 30864]KJE89315.1 hypothetical protein CAOG_000811 [Capsaspora owczarzaki ATCC 30864]|eukprot:XP_004365682.1 hypothetical protein CAOG_00811 [Capsaspora owczarzaki ATCC 30864]